MRRKKKTEDNSPFIFAAILLVGALLGFVLSSNKVDLRNQTATAASAAVFLK